MIINEEYAKIDFSNFKPGKGGLCVTVKWLEIKSVIPVQTLELNRLCISLHL